MTKFKSGERFMNGTHDRDCGTVVEVKPGCDANDHVIVRWDSGETDGCGADCLNSLDRGPYAPKKPQLEIIEPSTREAGAILVCDQDHNDIAEFYHNEHATVGQSYETALRLARALVQAPMADLNHIAKAASERAAKNAGVAPKHGGKGKGAFKPETDDDDESFADRAIQAEIDRACGIPTDDDWLLP